MLSCGRHLCRPPRTENAKIDSSAMARLITLRRLAISRLSGRARYDGSLDVGQRLSLGSKLEPDCWLLRWPVNNPDRPKPGGESLFSECSMDAAFLPERGLALRSTLTLTAHRIPNTAGVSPWAKRDPQPPPPGIWIHSPQRLLLHNHAFILQLHRQLVIARNPSCAQCHLLCNLITLHRN